MLQRSGGTTLRICANWKFNEDVSAFQVSNYGNSGVNAPLVWNLDNYVVNLLKSLKSPFSHNKVKVLIMRLLVEPKQRGCHQY